MHSKNSLPHSLPPQTSLVASTPSPTRPSPLSSGTLQSYPITASPFTNSPTFLPTSQESTPEQDYFDDFAYTSDMDEDFRRIDEEASQPGEYSGDDQDRASTEPPPPLSRNSKTWVVFRGRIPGIYDNGWELC